MVSRPRKRRLHKGYLAVDMLASNIPGIATTSHVAVQPYDRPARNLELVSLGWSDSEANIQLTQTAVSMLRDQPSTYAKS